MNPLRRLGALLGLLAIAPPGTELMADAGRPRRSFLGREPARVKVRRCALCGTGGHPRSTKHRKR